MNISRGHIACGLWVLAASLMVYETLNYGRDQTPAGFAWGVFVSVIAMTVTTIASMERYLRQQKEDDVTVEQIAEVVDALHDAKKDVARLISPHQ